MVAAMHETTAREREHLLRMQTLEIAALKQQLLAATHAKDVAPEQKADQADRREAVFRTRLKETRDQLHEA
jgi:hypothetical protein